MGAVSAVSAKTKFPASHPSKIESAPTCADLREASAVSARNLPEWVAKLCGFPWRIAAPTPGSWPGRTYAPARWAGMPRRRPQEGRSRPTGPAVTPRQSRPHSSRVEARAAMSSAVIRFMARVASTASMPTIFTSRASTSMPSSSSGYASTVAPKRFSVRIVRS